MTIVDARGHRPEDSAMPEISRIGPDGSEWPEEYVVARSVGELLLTTAREMSDIVARCAAPEGLTAFEARALRYMFEALPQHELAARLDCDPPRIATVVRRLEQLQLITRTPTEGDRRVRLVQLTDAGVDALVRVGRRLAALSPFLHELTLEECRTLEALLQRVSDGARRVRM
jgi:DNA-binding MarR family transcriptional regulator